MSRKLERSLLLAGGGWNLITGILTIFGYSGWFQTNGLNTLRYSEVTPMEASILLNRITTVIYVFGLLIFIGGILTCVIAKNLKDNQVQTKVLLWIGIWGSLQLLFSDVISFYLYSAAFILYLAKNKAIRRLVQNRNAHKDKPLHR